MKMFLLCGVSILMLQKICISQSIVSISPSSGYSGDNVTIHLITHNTHFTTWNKDAISFELVQGDTHIWYPWLRQFINDTTVDITFTLTHSKPLGLYDFVFKYNYYDPVPIILIKQNAFTIEQDPTPPRIVSLTTNKSMAGKVITTYILTENATFTDWSNFSYLVHGSDTIHAYTILSWQPWNMFVKFVLPFDTPIGLYDVHLGNYWVDGDIVMEDGFEITENPGYPSLISCTPSSVVQGGDIDLTISGENTSFRKFEEFNFSHLRAGIRKSDDHSIKSDYDWDFYRMGMNDSTLFASIRINYLLPFGTYDVYTVDPLCDTLYLSEALTILEGPSPPSLFSVDPDTIYAQNPPGNYNLGQFVTVTGINTHFNNKIDLYAKNNGIKYSVSYWQYYNDTSFKMYIEHPCSNPQGWYELHYINQYENMVLAKAFYIENPYFGIDEIRLSELKIYPNPTTGKFKLEISETIKRPIEITINNVTGQILKTLKTEAGWSESEINISDLPKGIYFVKLTSNKESLTQKLILQ